MSYRVIIVDDEPWSREVVKRLGNWKEHKIEVIGEASDGKAGLLLIEELKPHIVIMDMRMPGMDGIELMKELIKMPGSFKIIIISGYDDYNYVREAVKYRAMDYLLKPVNPEELNELLKKCIHELDTELLPEVRNYEPDAFLEVRWFTEYLTLRSLLKGCIKDLNSQTAANVLMSISKVVISNEGIEVSMGITMKLFYDLSWMLEQFVVGEDASIAQIVSRKFVFNSKTSFEDAINYLKELYVKVIDELQDSLRNRNRIDMIEIQRHIDNRYVENISLESVADYFYISKEYLSKMFKHHTGINFSEYITMKRMDKAKEMIVEHSMQIKNVSELLGYSDITHFYKNFKKYYGITPGEMRKNL